MSRIEDSIWMFLNGVKMSGTPTARANIVKQCQADSSLLLIICKHTRAAIKSLYSHKNGSNSLGMKGADSILSFFVAVTVEQPAFKEAHLRILHPFITEGISYHIPGGVEPLFLFRQSSFMILAQLFRSSTLSASYLQAILSPLRLAYSSADSSAKEEILCVLCIMVSFQKVRFPCYFDPMLH